MMSTLPPPAAEAVYVLAAYRRGLRTATAERFRLADGEYRVHWPGCADPGGRLRELLRAARAPRRRLKSSDINVVCRVDLGGEEAVLKQFRLPTLSRQLRYGLRPSRARRCWAAAHALLAGGLATPAPLAFVECRRHGFPVASYYICRDLPDAVPARRWIKAWYPRRPDAFRAAFRRQLLDCLIALYRRRIYHADTKASNLLLTHPEDPAARRFWWIDLDCMAFGVTPTRRLVLRNLVQLNGSIGARVSEADRMAFLHDLARCYPWAEAPGVARRIRTRTRQRLQRELDGLCGP
jgi:hypothetical protein